MTLSAAALPEALATAPGSQRRRSGRWASRLGIGGWLAVAVLAVVVLTALLGPLFISTDPNSVNLSYAYVGPMPGHPLGFDGQGRDLFARLVHGARTALIGPAIVVAVSTVLGTSIALVAAWVGGAVDAVVARVTDAMFAFPGLLLALLAVSLFSPGVVVAAVALSISYTPYTARIVRSTALKERSLPYVAALDVQGFGAGRIVVRHILPNILVTVVAVATLSFGYALIDLAALSFTGLGVQPPQSDWGVMVAEGVTGIIAGYPQESLFAGGLIVITVGAVNFLGDRIEGASGDPR
jgi:peptide/nickel transport system permease protein